MARFSLSCLFNLSHTYAWLQPALTCLSLLQAAQLGLHEGIPSLRHMLPCTATLKSAKVGVRTSRLVPLCLAFGLWLEVSAEGFLGDIMWVSHLRRFKGRIGSNLPVLSEIWCEYGAI